ncbi:MAG: peptidoglycan DD-metalloendopeptidase family protein, partial [Rhodothermales bacterium]
QKSAVDYVVFDIAGDTAAVYEGRREVKTERRRLAGSIENSLYRTLEEQDLSGRLVPELAMSLSEVFAWQVDFFRIMQGDDFSVIYEERSIDGEPIGIGRIVAARFGHRGTNYFGIYFERGDRPDFYDEEGNSLRKALLKAPLKFRRISSRYTQRRFHPVQQRYKAHLGTDYAADTGTPIYSVGDGVILEARFARYNGNYVKVRHNSTYTTGYLHMSRIASGIRPGVAVKQGQVIGYVGSTGLATGPHVCYRYWKNGVQIDPFTDDIPPAHPVDPNLRDEFMITRNQLLPLLLEPTSPHYAERVTVGTYGALL